MEGPLTIEERAAMQSWVESGNAPQQRRARIILLADEGHSVGAIAAEVRLSQRQVRHWLSAFREQRMGILPRVETRGAGVGDVEGRAEPEQPVPVTTVVDAEPAEPTPLAPLTVQELCARNDVDVERAAYVKGMALEFFDLTADVHRLAPQQRALLGAAATLHDVGLALDPGRRHLVGRDLILAQPIAGFDRAEQDMLASIVALQRKKVRRRREEAFTRLPAVLQRQTLALAALLRMAVGLQTQSTTIERVEVRDQSITVVVEGPLAGQDGAAAQRRSNLWHQLFDVQLNFTTAEQLAQVSLVVESELEPLSLPQLASPGLLADDPMSEAGRKVLWFHFLRMLKHEPGTRAGEDIEELHDMRVATRRMRAALRVFGAFFEPQVVESLNKGIRRVTRALGPVRDLDVFEQKAERYLQTLPHVDAARGGLEPLFASWQAERGRGREKMIAFLDSDRHKKFKRRLADFLQTAGAGARSIPQDRPVPYQVRHVSPRLIYTRYETVRAYETVLAEAQIETLHALRIDCKYLRYTLEFLREVLGPEGEAVIEEVKAMQDHLGDLNDAEVAIGLLSEFLDDWDTAQAHLPISQRPSAEGIVTYLANRHAEKHRLLTSFPEAWARLNREQVRRWLALAVAAL